MSNLNNILFIFILILIISNNFILNDIVCYERCLTCDYAGNEDNHNCKTCRYDYHFLPDGGAFCRSRDEVKLINNYHVNTQTNDYELCHIRCKECLDGDTPTDEAQYCSKCEEGLYKTDYDHINCYYPYEISNNYYKDTSLDPPIFKQCYERCHTCSELGDSENHKCDSCKGGTNSNTQYYKLDSGETGNCYLFEEIPDNYQIPLVDELNELATEKLNARNEITAENENYALIYERIATKCYKNCKTCTQIGDDIDMHCITCIEGYFFYKNNCYKKCPKPETYQLKETNYQCKELVEGYKIVTDYKTSTDIVNFLLFHGLGEFDFEKDLITANKIYGQIYSLKNKGTNDELAERLILSKIKISDECLYKIIDYYGLEEDVLEDLILIKFDRNYTNSRSRYKSSVNQVDFYLFTPFYTYDLISGEKILNGSYNEIELSVCQNIKEGIQIIKPLVNKNETLTGVNTSDALILHNQYNIYDVFLSSNIFFSDICATFKSLSKRDVELAERREKYYQNISFCEGNCVFFGFDYENYKITCDCDASLFLTSVQYDDRDFKDRKNRIKNLTFSTLSNRFPDNISLAYTTLNLKVMKCTHLIFNRDIAIKNFGNWFEVILFISKVVFLVYYFRRNALPINEEYNKRKEKIEQEFLAQIPDAEIMTYKDLVKIPKYHIERVIWSNYAGSFKFDKSKRNRKRFGQKDHIDAEANKFTYNGLLMNKNHVEVTENDLNDETNEKNETKEKNEKKEKKKNGNPPKRLGYIFSDERADEEKGEHYNNRNKVFKDALKDLNYTEKEKNTKKYFNKDKGNETAFANAIFPLSKENLNNEENKEENEKNTEKTTVKKKKKLKKVRNNPEKMDQMINDLMPLDYDKVEVEMKDKMPINRNENLKYNEAKLNQLINDEYEFKRDQKARRIFNEGKALQEENRQHRNKLAEKNHNRVPEDELEKEKENKKKKLKKKKFGNQNYLEDPDEVARYKKSYLDDEDIGENPFKIEPAINYRFSSMTSPEKLIFMNYNFAIDLDRRTFMEIYMGCVKMSQMIMNFIYIPFYHNMKFLKLYFFMFVINLNVFTTTIFYSHYYIGKMYGFKFLMCSIQCFFISAVLYLFSFAKKKFTSVHVLDIWKIAYYKKVYMIIVIIAIVVEFIFSGFIWFLSSAFCSVYQNSYIFYFLHLIESCIITLALPFLFSFLPALLRYLALIFEKKILFQINNYIDIFF